MPEETGATYETRAEAESDSTCRLWLRAIQLAGSEEKDWRDLAKEAVDRFRNEKANRAAQFNILYAHVETLRPAIYNSTPIPDVRRRFADKDPVGKAASDVIERALVTSMDDYDFDAMATGVVHDSLLPGRGLSRVRYSPLMSPDETAVADESVYCEPVQWEDFRRGPGKAWADVPWIAYRHKLTRDQLIMLNKEIGPKVNLDWVQKGEEDDSDSPDLFRRAIVWEVWDKEKREVLFIAESYKDAPLVKEPDPLGLEDFFPTPRPLNDIIETNSLIPLVPYETYKDQAQELDIITSRIKKLTKILRWRGIRPAQITELDRLKDADDGDLVPSESFSALLMGQGTNPDQAIWLMPIDKLIVVIRELVAQREQIKATIFEITGVADIMRGQSNPGETLGAQRLKTQWGSLRLQSRQREASRYLRDILRIKSEIISTKFSQSTLERMTGIKLPMMQPPQQMGMPLQQVPTWPDVMALLRSDTMRDFRIDIETDSTIQNDEERIQANMAQFVQGLGTFMAAVGPAVQSGDMPKDVATDLMVSFTRRFNLGRQAEDALERMADQPKAQDPAAAADAAKQAAQAQQQMEAQEKQAELQAKQQAEMMKVQADAAKTQAENESAQQQAMIKAQAEGAKMQSDQAFKAAENEKDRALEWQKFQIEMEFRAADPARALAQGEDEMNKQVMTMIEQMAQTVQAMQESNVAVSQAVEAMAQVAMAPRQARIIVGPDGEKTAVSEVVMQ